MSTTTTTAPTTTLKDLPRPQVVAHEVPRRRKAWIDLMGMKEVTHHVPVIDTVELPPSQPRQHIEPDLRLIKMGDHNQQRLSSLSL